MNYKDKAPKQRKNYNFAKVRRSMRELQTVVRKDSIVIMSELMLFTPSKHQASKRGYKHQHKATYKPPKALLTPAQWKRQKRKEAKKE